MGLSFSCPMMVALTHPLLASGSSLFHLPTLLLLTLLSSIQTITVQCRSLCSSGGTQNKAGMLGIQSALSVRGGCYGRGGPSYPSVRGSHIFQSIYVSVQVL